MNLDELMTAMRNLVALSSGSVFRIYMFLLVMMLCQGSALPAQNDNSPEGTTYVEEYYYEAVPIGKEEDREQIVATLFFEDNGIVLSSNKVSRKAEEHIRLKMTKEGYLISGTKTHIDREGTCTEGRIWRDEQKVYIEQTSAERTKTTVLDIPEGSTLAIEGSLIVLLRSFPYGSTTRWHLFIIDFSGRSVAATAEQAGVERITVPAGTFICYRVEILFDVPILNLKVVCWLARDKPHVLIKSVGKRSLLSPTYVSSLIKQRLPESPTRK